MKIGIDASRAFVEEKTGTEEYSYELIRHLASDFFKEDEIFLFVKWGTHIDFALPSNFFVKEIEGNFLWTQWHLSYELMRNPIDVLFVPAHTIPLRHPQKSVATIHGLEFKSCPDCYSRKDRWILDINTRLSILFAKKIITPSEGTKQEIVKFYKVPPEKISVIHHGASARKTVEGKKDKDEFDILFIGRQERRKNIVRMIRAFDIFMKKIAQAEKGRAGRKARLILAGKKGLGYEEIREEIAKSQYKDNITEKGYITQKQKELLYVDADIFLFPTLAEGFGLPVLEAMSYGVPVTTSRAGALQEIAGDAAILVDPTDEAGMADALLRIFTDKDKREELVRKGYENLKRFSWDKCAKETWKVISDW